MLASIDAGGYLGDALADECHGLARPAARREGGSKTLQSAVRRAIMATCSLCNGFASETEGSL